MSGVGEVQVIDDRPIGGSLLLRFIAQDRAVIARIAALPEVRVIDEVPEPSLDDAGAAGTLQSGTPGTQSIWNQGLHGEGQVIGVLDGNTLDMAHCFFQDPALATPGPAHRKVLAVRNAAGMGVGAHHTFVAGLAAGDDANNLGTTAGRGSAYNARLVDGTTADLASGSMLAELTAAAGAGATIHTNSWHDDDHGAGNPAPYNQTAVDVDTFTWNNEDHLVLGSAGNTGEEQGAPGTAKNAICCGAAQADPNEMNLGDGNPGPTLDNRRKPDLVSPGCNLTSADDGTACGTTMWGGACATSWATPTAAGAAALVRQYFSEGWYPTGAQEPSHAFIPSGALIKAVLLNGTLDMTGVAGYPNNTEGWGLLRLEDVLAFTGSTLSTRVWDFRNVDGLTTGQQHEHHVDVATNTQRLKVTLVWTEPPGAVNATTAIVNDLDLEVVSPGGAQLFRGNVFAAGVSTTGGAADTANNVEAVLVNAPAAGDWTIRVRATAVNVGNPGQGYALVVTADLTDPPVTTGTQDTLVVRVRFADIGANISLANLQSTLIDVADYIDEVSYGQATVVPMYRGVIDLAQNRDYYFHPTRNPLIELTEEVTAALVAAEPTLFDTIERMIIVTNDASQSGDWATTGPWPYTLPAGFTRPISVSIQGYQNSLARFTHGMLHQFGLVDLYAHEGVVFPRPYVDDWDNMGGTFDNVHPLIWSKQRAGWPAAHGDTVTFIARPAPGASYGGPNPLHLFRNPNPTANRKAIAIGLTQGASTVAAENAFYYVEARGNTQSNFDNGLPAAGVLIYYVNELVPQGEGPVILRDENLVTSTLDDASYEVGDVVVIPGTGITISVLAGTGGAPFDIQVDYTAPVTDYNVSIVRGDTINGRFYDWFSPDIWVDSPKNGWNQGAGPLPHDQREQPVAGMVNRLYARVPERRPGDGLRLRRPVPDLGAVPHGRRRGGLRQVRGHEAHHQPRRRRADRVHRLDACRGGHARLPQGRPHQPRGHRHQRQRQLGAGEPRDGHQRDRQPVPPGDLQLQPDQPVRDREPVLLPRRGRPGWLGRRSPAAQDPAGARRADHRAGDHHAAQGRRAVHVGVDRGDQLGPAWRHPDPGGRRRRPGGPAAADGHRPDGRRLAVQGQRPRVAVRAAQEGRQGVRPGDGPARLRPHQQQGLSRAARRRGGDHPQVRRPAGQRDLPHGRHGCQRLLRGLHGQHHARQLAGGGRVPGQQVRRP